MGDEPRNARRRLGRPRRRAAAETLTLAACAFLIGGCRLLPATPRRAVSRAAADKEAGHATTQASSILMAEAYRAPVPTKGPIRIAVSGPPDQQMLEVLYSEALRSTGYSVVKSRAASTQDMDRKLTLGHADLSVAHVDEALVVTRTAPPSEAERPATTAAKASTGKSRTPPFVAARGQLRVAAPGPLPAPSPDPVKSASDLNARLVGRDLQALLPAGGGHRLVLAANRAVAVQEGWHRISDVAPFAFRRRLGGPFGCSTDDRCAVMLRRAYGLRFKEIVEYGDSGARTGGTRAIDAAIIGDVDVSLARDDDPALAGGTLVVLEDDRRALPAGNFVPIVRRTVLDAELRAVLDTVSAAVGPDDLDVLANQVAGGQPVEVAAQDWLLRNGILGQKHS